MMGGIFTFDRPSLPPSFKTSTWTTAQHSACHIMPQHIQHMGTMAFLILQRHHSVGALRTAKYSR